MFNPALFKMIKLKNLSKAVLINVFCGIIFLGFILSCADTNASDQTGDQSEEIGFEFTTRIPAGGNAWLVNNAEKNSDIIYPSGIHNWIDKEDVISIYFATAKIGSLQVGLNAKVPEGITLLKVRLDGVEQEVNLSNSEYEDIEVGEFQVLSPGYHKLELISQSKTGTYIADVSELLLGGTVVDSGVTFIKEQENFYFGRRGPSDHLNFSIPSDKDIIYFYSEIEVPQNEDKIGSYFMANGFNYGYFGIQVNSETERRVIFSVWSPFATDDPSEIPDDQKIILLEKGEEVDAGEFGNEGSGGHSHLIYNWEAGKTYKFLLKGKPSVNNSSDYTAYFYAPELGKWQLIASFRRPETTSYLKGFYSFLENFTPNTGDQQRKAHFKNQWVYDTTGTWVEITEATFTVDATARAGRRLDYSGGVEQGSFFLRNCGFFSDNTDPDTIFTRIPSNLEPLIDFNNLN